MSEKSAMKEDNRRNDTEPESTCGAELLSVEFVEFNNFEIPPPGLMATIVQ